MRGASSLIRSKRHLVTVLPPISTSAAPGFVSGKVNSISPWLPVTLGVTLVASEPSSGWETRATLWPCGA